MVFIYFKVSFSFTQNCKAQISTHILVKPIGAKVRAGDGLKAAGPFYLLSALDQLHHPGH